MKCSTHKEGLLSRFGGTRKFSGSLKMLAMFMYLFSLIFLSRSIVSPLTAAKPELFSYNQPLTRHLQLYSIMDKRVMIVSYHWLRKLSLTLFPKAMLMHMNTGLHTDFLHFRKWAQVRFCTATALSSSLYWLRNERKFNSRDHLGPSNWHWQQTPMC